MDNAEGTSWACVIAKLLECIGGGSLWQKPNTDDNIELVNINSKVFKTLLLAQI